MQIKTRGIVFRSVKYGESSVIADIFTEDKGLHTFIAGGVRTPRSRMPYNLFQPMTVVELVSYFRDEAGAMNRLKELRTADVFTTIPFDIRHGAVAMFMAEICRKVIHEAEENRELFDFLRDYLLLLDGTPHPIANLHLHFLLHLSAYLGFQPHAESEDLPQEYFLDLQEGIFSPIAPLHAHHLDARSSAQVMALLQTEAASCHMIMLQRNERRALLNKLLQFYQIHMPGFTEPHTPEVLETIFNG
jgi:DNA repair protein RecO (recombination protein O)